MPAKEKKDKAASEREVDEKAVLESLKEALKTMEGQLRSVEYTANLELETYKRELQLAYDELNALRVEKTHLQKQFEDISRPPIMVGEVGDVLEEGEVIIRNGTGQSFITTVSKEIDTKTLSPGARVGLDRNNLTVMRVLSKGKDPMIMGSELIERPTTTYSDIGGLKDAVDELRETVELPLTDPEVFRRIGITPPSGVLLVGPPGTGKTLLAKAVANSAQCTFIRLVGSELVQKFIGEGGRLVRELFQLAKEKRPCIVFIDELDAIGAKRLGMDTTGDREVQRTLMQLLAEMDGFHPLENIGIIAATNRQDILDEALLRPGRFDRIIEVPLPDEKGREQILKIHTRNMKLSPTVKLSEMASSTEGFTGADLRNLCTESGMYAIRRKHRSVMKEDMESALKKVMKRREHKGTKAPEGMFR